MKLKVGCSMGLTGCRIEDELEIEDGTPAEVIQQLVRDWALEHFDWWSARIPEDRP